MLLECDGLDGCGETFKTNGLKVDKIQGGIEKNCFKCPHCGKEFVSFYTDEEIRGKQKRLRKTKSVHVGRMLKREFQESMEELRVRVESRAE